MTEEEKAKDINDRRTAFKDELDALMVKHQTEIVSGPQLVPIGMNLFAITMTMDLRDTRYREPVSVPSPFNGNDLIT